MHAIILHPNRFVALVSARNIYSRSNFSVVQFSLFTKVQLVAYLGQSERKQVDASLKGLGATLIQKNKPVALAMAS